MLGDADWLPEDAPFDSCDLGDVAVAEDREAAADDDDAPTFDLSAGHAGDDAFADRRVRLAYDDDDGPSPGATAGCGGGVSTGLAAGGVGKGGVAAGFFLKKDVKEEESPPPPPPRRPPLIDEDGYVPPPPPPEQSRCVVS